MASRFPRLEKMEAGREQDAVSQVKDEPYCSSLGEGFVPRQMQGTSCVGTFEGQCCSGHGSTPKDLDEEVSSQLASLVIDEEVEGRDSGGRSLDGGKAEDEEGHRLDSFSRSDSKLAAMYFVESSSSSSESGEGAAALRSRLDAGDRPIVRNQTSQDEYVIKDLLGSGSFGEVFRAARLRDGKEFALKVPYGRGKASKTELAVLGTLQEAGGCDYVVRLIDSAYHDTNNEGGYRKKWERKQCLCIVMELCDSCLDQFVKSHNLPQAVRMEICRQLVAAVSFCHRHNVMHCDIKLPNILVSLEQACIKLTDFGLSKHVHVLDPPADCTESMKGKVNGVNSVSTAEAHRLVCNDLDQVVAVIMEIFLGSRGSLCNIVDAFNEKVASLGPLDGEAFNYAGWAIGYPGSVATRMQNLKTRLSELSQNASQSLDLQSTVRDFFLWWCSYPASDYSDDPCALSAPEVLIDNCLLLCYQLDDLQPLSSALVEMKLEEVISEATRSDAVGFFHALVGQKE